MDLEQSFIGEGEEEGKFSTLDEVMTLIMDSPGITTTGLSEKLGVSMTNVYNYIARLRKQMRVKTIHRGTKSSYYPFDFVVVEVPGLEKPGVKLRIGDGMATARTLSADELKAMMAKPSVPSKYASLIGYLDRINVGEAAVFSSKEIQIDNTRGRIYDYFNKNKSSGKHFSINTRGEYIVIERTQ